MGERSTKSKTFLLTEIFFTESLNKREKRKKRNWHFHCECLEKLHKIQTVKVLALFIVIRLLSFLKSPKHLIELELNHSVKQNKRVNDRILVSLILSLRTRVNDVCTALCFCLFSGLQKKF